MNFIEQRIAELENYKPDVTTPEDLDVFWSKVLEETRNTPLHSSRERMDTPMSGVDAYHVVYQGIDGTPIHGHYMVPTVFGKTSYPCIVNYHGYHGNKGLPEHFAAYLMSGFAVFSIDVRGQSGDTGDLTPQQQGKTSGWMTKGILSPEDSYYKWIITDAIRAIDWVREQPEVDADRVGVVGGSQGGGLALAVSALGCRHAFAVADIPNMCHLDWAVFNSSGSISEVATYVAQYPDHLQAALRTLSYFDNKNLADRIEIPILVCVGFKDPICPPESVYAMYNRVSAPKQIINYPFSGHWPGDKHIRKVLNFILQQIQ
ncbi:acetylesterase [Paenibacillus selenitireducens]|uniref:Acetylesterase n=1 Tax=Paenibacillus selenitireducens TaxID=1324314 RepID=A0A1T2X256_9BACL|nr:alpha/beta fold hydrolase [Paenibacillus selenitireducens]OPA73950.1 acetylesterase [Paenibacillus selenitireducens]